MKKFTLTRLSELEPQDRFYFPKFKYNICTYIETIKSGYDIKYLYKDENNKVQE